MKASRFWTAATILGCLAAFLAANTASAEYLAPADHGKKSSGHKSHHGNHHHKPHHKNHHKKHVNVVHHNSTPFVATSQPRSVRMTYDVYHNGTRYGSYFSMAEAQEVLGAVRTYRGGQVFIKTFSW